MTPPPHPHDGGPPAHHPPPPAPPHWASTEGMKDEDVLRFAPPEIRRLWRRVVAVETQVTDIKASLLRIEEILRSRNGGA